MMMTLTMIIMITKQAKIKEQSNQPNYPHKRDLLV